MSKSSWLNWLDSGLDIAKVITGATPIGAMVTVVDAVVESVNDGVSNDSVIDTIEAMSKSSWNNLTPEKVEKMKALLLSDDEPLTRDNIAVGEAYCKTAKVVVYKKEPGFIWVHNEFNRDDKWSIKTDTFIETYQRA